MARYQQLKFLNFLFVVVLKFSCFVVIRGQNYQNVPYPQQYPYNYPYDPYNQNQPYPSDRNYMTYFYNDRRYGQQPNTYNNFNGYPGDPRFTGQDPRYTYDQVNFYYILTISIINTHSYLLNFFYCKFNKLFS